MIHNINIKDLTFSYNNNPILNGVSLEIKKGQFTGILGPNGCGKTTLLKNILRYLSPEHGVIEVKDINIKEYKSKDLAKTLSFVPQKSSLTMPLTVKDVIYMGRVAHMKNSWVGFGKDDNEKVERVMKILKLEKFKDRSAFSLSGGEFQRVLLARALVQEPEILLLDEPTSALDMNYALEIMKLTSHFVKAGELTGIMVLHDLNLASMYCDNIIFLKNGNVKYVGTPKELFKPEILEEVYGFKCTIIDNGDYPHVLPIKI
ncbi:MAG: ABC transporter ATP-binding protein [Sebaldella sp.]|nr:ABC transporter ATP-binding protein [Sebaldella sp.]